MSSCLTKRSFIDASVLQLLSRKIKESILQENVTFIYRDLESSCVVPQYSVSYIHLCNWKLRVTCCGFHKVYCSNIFWNKIILKLVSRICTLLFCFDCLFLFWFVCYFLWGGGEFARLI